MKATDEQRLAVEKFRSGRPLKIAAFAGAGVVADDGAGAGAVSVVVSSSVVGAGVSSLAGSSSTAGVSFFTGSTAFFSCASLGAAAVGASAFCPAIA